MSTYLIVRGKLLSEERIHRLWSHFSGVYNLMPRSCHQFDQDVFIYNTWVFWPSTFILLFKMEKINTPYPIVFNIICWILCAFLLVLSYDLLEGRRVNNVIIGNFLSLYSRKQMDLMLPCVCSVVLNHRRCQNVVKTSVTHSAIASCATFLFLPHFWRHLWSTAEQTHGNMELFVKLMSPSIICKTGFILVLHDRHVIKAVLFNERFFFQQVFENQRTTVQCALIFCVLSRMSFVRAYVAKWPVVEK